MKSLVRGALVVLAPIAMAWACFPSEAEAQLGGRDQSRPGILRRLRGDQAEARNASNPSQQPAGNKSSTGGDADPSSAGKSAETQQKSSRSKSSPNPPQSSKGASAKKTAPATGPRAGGASPNPSTSGGGGVPAGNSPTGSNRQVPTLAPPIESIMPSRRAPSGDLPLGAPAGADIEPLPRDSETPLTALAADAKSFREAFGLLLTEESDRITVAAVDPGSSAMTGGMLVGDEITGLGGVPVQHQRELFEIAALMNAGDQIEVQVHRAGATQTVLLEASGTVGASAGARSAVPAGGAEGALEELSLLELPQDASDSLTYQQLRDQLAQQRQLIDQLRRQVQLLEARLKEKSSQRL